MTKTVALYAGSFDPITRGHLDILDKAVATFDEVHIAIGINPLKKRMFTMPSLDTMIITFKSLMEHFEADQKRRIIHKKDDDGSYSFSHPDVPVVLSNYTGSVTKHANKLGATHLVRGLRQASDFNDEFSLTGVISHVDVELIMTHFICNERFLHISSSTARELASLHEDVSWLVTPVIEEALKEKFK